MALWTPADYGTQSALDWFDANDPAITLVSGNISVWPNKGGYNGNASQATSGRRPPLTTNLLNSLPGAVFTAAQELVTATKTMGGTPLHTFSVFRYIVDGSTTYPGVAGVFGGGNGLSGDVGIQIFQVYDDGTDQFALTGNGYAGGTPNVNVLTSTAGVGSGSHVTAGRLSSVGNQIKVDGSVISGAFGSVAGNVPSIAGHGLVLGAIDDSQALISDNGPWSGYLHEHINVWAALADADVEIFEGYLAWKWGLQGQLPSGHPYKNAAPTTGITLTGQSATGSGGTLTPSNSLALTGKAGTGAIGSLTPSRTKALTGFVGTGAQGSLTPSRTVALTGLSATGAIGALSAGSPTSAALTGRQATGAGGALSVSVTVALTGVAASGQTGSIGSSRSTALTGKAATAAKGLLGLGTRSIVVTGQQATGQIGILTPPMSVTVALTGLGAVGLIGVMSPGGGLPISRTAFVGPTGSRIANISGVTRTAAVTGYGARVVRGGG